MQRTPTNTESLQQQFPEVYRDFFAISQRVASASHSFLWAGDFSGFYGGLTIVQKLPLSAYVGLETTFDHKVVVNAQYQAYEPAEHRFSTNTLDTNVQRSVQRYFEQELKPQSEFTGLKVHILTETPLGHELGGNGAIAAAVAVVCNPDAEFDQHFAMAREILSLMQAGHSSGASAYAALSEAETPLIFRSAADRLVAMPLAELTKLQNPVVWPIDFGLIYTGSQSNAESVVLANDHTIEELDQATKQLGTLIDGTLKLNFKQTYIDMLNMTTGLMINALADLFSKGTSNQRLEHLFNALNQYQNLLHILEISSSATNLVYARIHQLADKQVNDVGSGAKISGIGKGGAMLFALPFSNHRGEVVRLVEQLRTETGKDIWLDYASWLDGIGGRAGTLEQDLTHGKRSSFIDHDILSLLILNRGQLASQVVTNERFLAWISEVDIVVDKTTDKIFIGGHPVTSKELPSQKSAVAILSALISAPNFTLKNSDLPGSYGTNRYDLHGKIVLPLIKEVKARHKRDLQLSVQGSMYDDYTLSLDPSNVIIGVVERKV